jgi:hypothetical protein
VDQDDRQFMHELLLRFDRIVERSDRRFERVIAGWEERADRRHDEAMSRFAQLDAKSDELMQESRASRQALLAILDRMDNGGTAPAT